MNRTGNPTAHTLSSMTDIWGAIATPLEQEGRWVIILC